MHAHRVEQQLASLLASRPSLHDLRDWDLLKGVMMWRQVNVPHGNMPPPRNCHTLVALGRTLVLMGGCYEPSWASDCMVLDMGAPPTLVMVMAASVHDCAVADSLLADKSAWSRLHAEGPPPCPRYAHTAVAVGSRMFVFGGYSQDGQWLNDLHVLDACACACTWSWRRPRPAARCSRVGAAAQLARTRACTCGASPPAPAACRPPVARTAVWQQEARWWCLAAMMARSCSTMCGCWTRVRTLPARLPLLAVRPPHAATRGSSRMTDTMAWSQPRTQGGGPSARSCHSAVAWNNKLVIFGGVSQWAGSLLGDMHVLDMGAHCACAFLPSCAEAETSPRAAWPHRRHGVV